MLTPVGRGFIEADRVAQAADRKVMFRFQFHSDLYKDMDSDGFTRQLNAVGNNAP